MRPGGEKPRWQVESGDQEPKGSPRVICEVQAGVALGGAAVGVDSERTDLPVGRNGADHDKGEDKSSEEEPESELAAPAPLFLEVLVYFAATPEWEAHPG